MPKKIDEVKLFETVIHDWMTHGYVGTTTKAIAKIAGINEATLFRRYGSKAGLFARAVDHQLADTPLANIKMTGVLLADLSSLATAYVATFEAHGDVVFRTLQESPRHPEVKEAMTNLLSNIQKMIQLVGFHQQQGHLKDEHPMLTLTSFIGPIATYLMFKQSGLRDDIPAFNVEAHLRLFLEGRGV
ncbi:MULTISPECIES: TetR/AcrR family transcriptional regulator [Shewanella]|jgi:AcrR family transcriptional regulator|uniref:TetR/AcrR family transcriptional regulator n=1 Tax=Shewanella TaxID=22 RepID=UPI001CF92889|nr:TetR/AcrR family transcriptional regulator [Shewanella glacialimarina]